MSAISVPDRLLLGSGPSPVSERVLRALAQPTVGHMDPAFGEIMQRTAASLRRVFGTDNRATLPLSATGSGGMDALVANFVEPGQRVVCAINGLFGERMADALGRAGAEVVAVRADWGRAVAVEQLVQAAASGLDAMVVVHGETSTGVCQPLEGLAQACSEHDALLLLDCVTSLSGQALGIDAEGVDAAFAGSQKCLNCPPGLAPFTAGERALGRLGARRQPPRSWYFDLSLLLGYWTVDQMPGDARSSGRPGAITVPRARAYHHTAPINMIYALAEALELVLEEEPQARWERHRVAHEALRAALAELGFERLAPEGEALHPLLAVTLPAEAEDARLRAALLERHGIEVSGGLGPLAGRIWRIGVMGIGAAVEPQRRLVKAVASELGRDPGDALGALEAGWSA